MHRDGSPADRGLRRVRDHAAAAGEQRADHQETGPQAHDCLAHDLAGQPTSRNRPEQARMLTLEDQLKAERERWERERLGKRPPGPATTDAGLPVDPLYTPADLADFDYLRDLGFPGEFPFTRGVYPTMYRGNYWTMRQYAGFDSAEDSNAWYKQLLAQGQTGLSVAFDLPSHLGYDSDDPRAVDDVGQVGVAIDTVEDVERLFDDIPIDQVSVNFTINAPAAVILAMYVAIAQRRGVPLERLAGTL